MLFTTAIAMTAFNPLGFAALAAGACVTGELAADIYTGKQNKYTLAYTTKRYIDKFFLEFNGVKFTYLGGKSIGPSYITASINGLTQGTTNTIFYHFEKQQDLTWQNTFVHYTNALLSNSAGTTARLKTHLDDLSPAIARIIDTTTTRAAKSSIHSKEVSSIVYTTANDFSSLCIKELVTFFGMKIANIFFQQTNPAYPISKIFMKFMSSAAHQLNKNHDTVNLYHLIQTPSTTEINHHHQQLVVDLGIDFTKSTRPFEINDSNAAYKTESSNIYDLFFMQGVDNDFH